MPATIDYGEFKAKPILYLYNPFYKELFRQVLDRLCGNDILLIYQNPGHAELPIAYGFNKVVSHYGFHRNIRAVIYRRNSYVPVN